MTLTARSRRWEGNAAPGGAGVGHHGTTGAKGKVSLRFFRVLPSSSSAPASFLPPQPHLLHGQPLLHQQDLLHALPVRGARRRSRQSRRQRQEEELMPRRPFPGAAPSPPLPTGPAGPLGRPINRLFCSFVAGLVPPPALSAAENDPARLSGLRGLRRCVAGGGQLPSHPPGKRTGSVMSAWMCKRRRAQRSRAGWNGLRCHRGLARVVGVPVICGCPGGAAEGPAPSPAATRPLCW